MIQSLGIDPDAYFIGMTILFVILLYFGTLVFNDQRRLIKDLRKQVEILENESIELMKRYAMPEDIVFDTQGGYRIVKKDDKERNTCTTKTGD